MNAPDRLDAIRVPEGVKKVVATKDEKAANAYIYKVMREDHTLGNIMRM
jgi:DNA-directed RNA polymerase II subunit RPB11